MTKISVYVVSIFILLVSTSCEESTSHPLYIQGDGVFDIEDNYYNTVIIGDQEWMAENLKTNLYCNGDSIPYQGSDVRVKTYENNPFNEEIHGKLYNFQSVIDTSGLCPCGWHIPNELEYMILIDYLGGYEKAMKRMKSIGSIARGNGLWSEREPTYLYEGNNASGFNALPSGYGLSNTFKYKDSVASFWSLSVDGEQAIEYQLGILNQYVSKQVYENSNAKEVLYYSIRCIKDL